MIKLVKMKLKFLHAEEASVGELSGPGDFAVLRRLNAGNDSRGLFGRDVVHGLLIPPASERPERQISSCNVIKCDANRPQINRGSKGLADRFAEHGSFVHVRMEVLFRAVKGHKLLIVVQLPGSSKVRQLVNGAPIQGDKLHNVARLQVPVHQVVVTQVLHSSCKVLQNQQEFIFWQTVAVLRVIKDVEEASTCAELHNDDPALAILLLLNGQQLDNVFVLHLLEHLKFSHLDLLGPHVGQLVEGFHRHSFSSVLEMGKKMVNDQCRQT